VASLAILEAEEVEMLFDCADEALYQAKGAGRNRVAAWKSGPPVTARMSYPALARPEAK
jgi:predicted signal transduction protein with EAL and GGDEF domain